MELGTVPIRTSRREIVHRVVDNRRHEYSKKDECENDVGKNDGKCTVQNNPWDDGARNERDRNTDREDVLETGTLFNDRPQGRYAGLLVNSPESKDR